MIWGLVANVANRVRVALRSAQHGETPSGRASGHVDYILITPKPERTPSARHSELHGLFLRRGLMIHNRNRDKAERWAAAHMAMFNEIYSGADNG